MGDLSDPALQTAPRENLLAFLRYLKNSPAAEGIEGDGFARWRTGFPMIWFNGVLVTWPPRTDESALIGETID